MMYKLQRCIGLVYVSLFLMGIVEAVEVVRLDFPDFSESCILNKKIGMTVSRCLTLKSAIHYYGGKPVVVVHNYGSEEGGWTYAPGRMELAYEHMHKGCRAVGKNAIPERESVAVLGAGVNGMMIANRLAKEGYAVTVYAERFSPNTLSDNIKIGVFIPFLNGNSERDSIVERLEKSSYEAYSRWVQKEGDSKSVRPIDLYVVDDDGGSELSKKESIIPLPNLVEIEIGYHRRLPALKYQSFAIDTGLFMKEMMEESKRLGVKFVNMKLLSLMECMKFGASMVFNCIGLEPSELLVEKKEVYLTSQTMSMETSSRIDYAVYVKHEGGGHTYLFPGKNNAITVAGTFLAGCGESVSESEGSKRLLGRAQGWLKNHL